MSFISLIIVKCALKHTGVVAKKSNLIAPLPPLMPHHSGRQWKMAAISVNLDLCGEKENFLFRKMFRSLVCPPAFGPAKRSQNFGPFRTAFPHFRRFAFRVSLSLFRDARVWLPSLSRLSFLFMPSWTLNENVFLNSFRIYGVLQLQYFLFAAKSNSTGNR
jgi:hypothetical protein